jgi:5'-methylthioadenosine phosphorylase
VASYALIATATDYDSWREQEEAVTASEVFKTLKANADISRHVAEAILDDLQAAITNPSNDRIFLEETSKMKFSIMPRSAQQKDEDRAKLAYVLPEYFSGIEGDDVISS